MVKFSEINIWNGRRGCEIRKIVSRRPIERPPINAEDLLVLEDDFVADGSIVDADPVADVRDVRALPDWNEKLGLLKKKFK